MGAFLLLRSRGRLCAVALEAVREIMRPLGTEPVAGLSELVLGATVVRGVPAPVVDLGFLLAGGPRGRAPARWVTLALGERLAVLAVDEVLDVTDIEPAALQRCPPALSTEACAEVAVRDLELCSVLAAARLVPDEVFDVLQEAR